MTPKELNVGFLKRREIQARKAAEKVSASVKERWSSTKEQSPGWLRSVEERGEDMAKGFATLFSGQGRDEAIVRIVSE